jgi:hypothetical protein
MATIPLSTSFQLYVGKNDMTGGDTQTRISIYTDDPLNPFTNPMGFYSYISTVDSCGLSVQEQADFLALLQKMWNHGVSQLGL